MANILRETYYEGHITVQKTCYGGHISGDLLRGRHILRDMSVYRFG